MTRKIQPREPFKWSHPVVLGTLLLLPLVAIASYSIFREKPRIELSEEPLPISRRQQKIELGGIVRPQTDFVMRTEALDVVDEARRVQRESVPKGRISDHPERYPILKEEMNANVKNTLEAVRTGENPERLTPNLQPAPFDERLYQANPQAYLDVTEPGRVYQSAQPGPDVKSIGARSKRKQTIKQLESVRLQVRAAPGAPVTFTSFDMGAFENKLPSITVAADESGTASAVFTGTAGTTDDVDILAASPVTSGRVHFVVTVLENR